VRLRRGLRGGGAGLPVLPLHPGDPALGAEPHLPADRHQAGEGMAGWWRWRWCWWVVVEVVVVLVEVGAGGAGDGDGGGGVGGWWR